MSCCRRNTPSYGFDPQSPEQVEQLYQQGFLTPERYQELMAQLTTERKTKLGALGILAALGLGGLAVAKLMEEE